MISGLREEGGREHKLRVGGQQDARQYYREEDLCVLTVAELLQRPNNTMPKLH